MHGECVRLTGSRRCLQEEKPFNMTQFAWSMQMFKSGGIKAKVVCPTAMIQEQATYLTSFITQQEFLKCKSHLHDWVVKEGGRWNWYSDHIRIFPFLARSGFQHTGNDRLNCNVPTYFFAHVQQGTSSLDYFSSANNLLNYQCWPSRWGKEPRFLLNMGVLLVKEMKLWADPEIGNPANWRKEYMKT